MNNSNRQQKGHRVFKIDLQKKSFFVSFAKRCYASEQMQQMQQSTSSSTKRTEIAIYVIS